MNGHERKAKITVVVPCLGQAAELRKCLAALAHQDIDSPYEVIVVDSGHDAAVVDAVRNFRVARVVRGDPNLEAGLARNIGARVAVGRYLVFTDADCVPAENFLKAVEIALDNGIRAMTGPILDADKRLIAACDNLLQFADYSPGRPAGPAQYAPGCALAMHRHDFNELGGFLSGRAEDVRFSLKLADELSGGLMFCPEMVIRHQGRKTLMAFIQHQKQFGFDRGKFGVLVSPAQRRLGKLWLMLLPTVMKRFAYIAFSNRKWKRQPLSTFILLTPLLFAGLVAWSVGFRRGLLFSSLTSDRTYG